MPSDRIAILAAAPRGGRELECLTHGPGRALRARGRFMQLETPPTHLDLDKLRAAPRVTDPFEYTIVPAFLPPASVRAVNATYPPIAQGGSFPIGSLAAGMAVK